MTLRPVATPELVIFDCDGVLVDSERISNQVLLEMFDALGLRLSLADMFEHFVGHSLAQVFEILSSRFGVTVPPTFGEELHRRMDVAMAQELKTVPGVLEVLDALPIPACVASNGTHQKMRSTLGTTGLLPRFEGKLFSATDVSRGKPHPDLFLHAAKHFGVKPSSCAVVEDTPTGVAAGVAAGMNVYGYAALTPAERLTLAGAHRVFADMRELPSLLGIARRALSS